MLNQLPKKYLGENHSPEFIEYRDSKWSKHGYTVRRPVEFNPESDENRYRCMENAHPALRFVGTSHGVCKREGSRRVNHTGWFVDNYQDETVQGAVYQLPTRRDHKPRYVPALLDPWNENCALMDFHSITDDLLDAAIIGDQMAERFAEESREEQAKDDAEQYIREAREEISTLYSEFRELCAELRGNCDKLTGLKQVHAVIRDHWRETRAKIEKLRRKIDRINKYGMEY